MGSFGGKDWNCVLPGIGGIVFRAVEAEFVAYNAKYIIRNIRGS